MEKLARYLSPTDAAACQAEMARSLGVEEYAVVKNLDYVYAPNELYPLAPKVSGPFDRIAAFAVDMDGTSTTTEPLALHALEYMVRRFTGRLTPEEWPGLDPVKDHPYVIGNSNFRHTEFLVNRYREALSIAALRDAFFEALVWTLGNIDDPQRLRDIRKTAQNCGLRPLLGMRGLAEADPAELVAQFGHLFAPPELISPALDIYYARYHQILREVERGNGESLSWELLGSSGRRLIEPMPGYAVFVALIKGWLGEDAGSLAPVLEPPPHPSPFEKGEGVLRALGRRFEERPAKLALVTASISFEAHAVVKEVFRVMAEEVAEWPLPEGRKRRVAEAFEDYGGVYDAFVTASDSSEARLKPHRDLFSIALYQMAVPKDEYPLCVGLEDTEPGIIALRATGIGCAVALPNHDTSRQDYRAAARVVKGGLPELILRHGLLLRL